MCIENAQPVGPDEVEGITSKTFKMVSGKLYGEYSSPDFLVDTPKPRPVNRWLKASDFQGENHTRRGPLNRVRPGWFLWGYILEGFDLTPSRRSSTKGPTYLALKVKYRKAHTKGNTSHLTSQRKVIIADEMLILPGQLNRTTPRVKR